MEKKSIERIAVYCGASPGQDPKFAEQAFLLGTWLAKQGKTLVFGGGRVGLMGRVAEGALQSRGRVIGVIPTALRLKEVAHEGVTELIEVDSMHTRKMKMYEESQAFIAMPGGYGTLDELFEILTWAQLGMHKKPVGLLNIAGYFDGLLTFLERAQSEQLLRREHGGLLLVDKSIEGLISKMEMWVPPAVDKWIDKDKT